MSKKKEEEKENRLKVVHIVIARCRLLSYILQSFISCRNAFNIKLFLQTQTILSLEHHWKKFEISNLKYGRHSPFSCFKAVPNFWDRRRRRWLWRLLRHCKGYNTASSNLDLSTTSFCHPEINENGSLFLILSVSSLIQRPTEDHGGRDWGLLSVWRWKTDWYRFHKNFHDSALHWCHC